MGFMDMREWMKLLEKAGELRRITAEVDWDREIGAVARRVLEKKGTALLFENIKGYGSGRCTQLFVSGLGARSRLALALGFQREVANRELVQHVMKKNQEAIAPVVVATGPVKEVIIRGDAIDQAEFPVPKWHYLEGGRYIHTFSGIVTRDPDTRVMNVGIYRGMIGPTIRHRSSSSRVGSTGRALRQVGCPQGAHAGRVRDRLGSHHAVPGRFTGCARCMRVGRDGCLSGRAGAASALRDGRTRGSGERGDRHRGDHQRRPDDLRDRRAVRGIYRLCVRPSHAASDHEDHLHYAPSRSDLPWFARRHAAGFLQRE